MVYKGYVHEGMVQGFVLGKLVKYDLRVIRLWFGLHIFKDDLGKQRGMCQLIEPDIRPSN